MKKLVDEPGLRISIGKRAAKDATQFQLSLEWQSFGERLVATG